MFIIYLYMLAALYVYIFVNLSGYVPRKHTIRAL